MQVGVFGTGYIYQKYKNEISRDICCLIDNAPNKQGIIMDGIKVISPAELDKYEYSYVIIMVSEYEEIEKQLMRMGISKDKILYYTQIAVIGNVYPQVHIGGSTELVVEWLRRNANKQKFLLVSHDFSYTGVPIALMNMALVLKKMGYAVIMAGLTGGRLVKELSKKDIAYLEEINLCYETEWFEQIALEFNYIVVGTFVLNKFVFRCTTMNVKLLWWIHESDNAMYDRVSLPRFSENIKVFGVGNRVIQCWKNHYANVDIKKLHYCIPDTRAKEKGTDIEDGDSRFVFAVIGTISYRKAQDIVVDAIGCLPQTYREKLRCVIVGSVSGVETDYCENIESRISNMEEIEMLGELDQEQVDQLYRHINVLLCPSRDDPMPIVVTQAMAHARPCIISENVGQSEYIKQGENGFVFRNQDVDEMAECMIWAMDHRQEMDVIGMRSRKIFEEEFSKKTMKAAIQNIVAAWNVQMENRVYIKDR